MKKIKTVLFFFLLLLSTGAFTQGVSIQITHPTVSTSVFSSTAATMTIVGYGAGMGGGENSLYGFNAGTNVTGKDNCVFGHIAGAGLLSGYNNSLFGQAAGWNLAKGHDNAMFGQAAGYGGSDNDASYNAFFGDNAGHNCNFTQYVSCLGYNAGATPDGGSYNTFLGAGADVYPLGTLHNYATAIGAGSSVGQDNSLILGREPSTSGGSYDNIGIGTVTPLHQLHVNITSGEYFQLDGIGAPVSSSYQMLVLDANDYVSVIPAVPVGAENGCSVDVNNEVALGQNFMATGAPATLTNNREIPMNGNQIFFTDNATQNGLIGIGTSSPTGKLSIYRQSVGDQVTPTGLTLQNSDVSSTGTNAVGVSVTVDNSGNSWNAAIQGVVHNGTTINQGAGFVVSSPAATSGTYSILYGGTASGADQNIGYDAVADAYNTNTSSFGTTTYGGLINGENGLTTNIGINTSGISTNFTSNNYGLYAIASGGATSYGVYADGSTYAGYFNGDVYCTGMYLPSDEHLKSNVSDFQNGLALIKKLDPKTYTFNTEQYKNSINLPSGDQIGIMAQNMKSVFPNLVKESIAPGHIDPMTHKKDGKDMKFLAVNYTGLIPALVQSAKELDATQTDLQNQVSQLKRENQELRNMINELCNGGCATLNGSISNPSAGTINQLLQNVPNPFSGQTIIGYAFNTGTEAHININGLDGKLIKQIVLTTKGNSSIAFGATDISTGTYTYTMYVDGNIIDTKIMVINSGN